MRKANRLTGLVAAGLFAGSASAAVDFQITEIYTGITGEDGTPDWIEITNFGDMVGDTGILFYDDSSLDIADGVALPSVALAPGDSAVFIVTGDADAQSLVDFETIWGVAADGFATGGGGLSQNGDTAAILLGDNTVVDSVAFPSLPSASAATIEDLTALGEPSFVLSSVGVNGAFESNPFFNDNIGDASDQITLIGSPGVVPEPASAVLVTLGALSAFSRRRV